MPTKQKVPPKSKEEDSESMSPVKAQESSEYSSNSDEEEDLDVSSD